MQRNNVTSATQVCTWDKELNQLSLMKAAAVNLDILFKKLARVSQVRAHHHVVLSGKNRYLKRLFFEKNNETSTLPWPQTPYLFKISSRNPYGQIEHKQISILTKSQLPNPKSRPNNALRTIPESVAINRPQSTSPQTLLEPFKIKDLSLLTHLYMKRVSWRLS